MTDKQWFDFFIVGLIFSFIAGCLIFDAILKAIKSKKAQRIEIETLRRENYRLKAVIECYETWNIRI